MQQYTVTGMHCAACSASVEKAVKKVPGVTSCAVSLLTNSMGVEGTAEPAAVIKAVEDAGYGASVRGQEATPAADASALEDRQTPHLKKRLIASVAFLLILMYFSMGHMMWGWPLPSWFDGNHVAMGLVQLLLAGIVMVINQEFFVSGTKSLLRGSPNMDTLVSIGAAASYGWSVYALFAMTDAQLHGGSEAAMAYMDEFYFESAAMILTLITVGKLLEAHSKGKTTDALKSLMALAPETATVIRDGKEVKIPAAQVRKGDVFVVRPGQSILCVLIGHLTELAGAILRVGNDLPGLLLGGIEHLAVRDLALGLQIRLTHHPLHVPLGLVHKFFPGGQQFLSPLQLHRKLVPQLVQQIQHLVPVHHAEVGLQGGGLGVLDPFIQHIN